MKSQLKEMYLRTVFHETLKWRFRGPQPAPDTITDIYEGKVYQAWMRNGVLWDSRNISFNWYTDSIPVFKSSRINLWPLIQQLTSYHSKQEKKRDNTLLVGYWFGDTKLDMNRFLYIFRDEINGIARVIEITLPNNTKMTIQGEILTCDSTAKNQYLNFIQFNGDYGCRVCLCKCERMAVPSNGLVHVYRYSNEIILRTLDQSREFAANAENSEHPIMGVNGYTVLSTLMPNSVDTMSIDRMHGCDSGG
ncbi:hypothetical protein PV327_001615 [Microctonus hyperodae]|uniref:Uncharacterized protein n=1 Tax=Microctonus hyperodae TaxID=165561 RepID=A0AA39FE14_MICHY|nr:hypothetical protein PV327_001615 [Microctonus hyperodae]